MYKGNKIEIGHILLDDHKVPYYRSDKKDND
jgi:hypothetical protein